MVHMGFIGLPELLVLAVVVFLLFGRKRLPQMGSSMRSAAIGFKRGLTGATPKDIVEGQEHVVRPVTADATSPEREPVPTAGAATDR
jgi:TatA/E family protein of Tat protein translocase